jgi:hypothetical protein
MELEKDTWLWIIVQNPGGNEMFLGQYDENKDTSFIPAFFEKDDAKASLDLINKDDSLKYEVQAIKYGLLEEYCKGNNFVIFICNAKGEILQKPLGE